MASLRLVLNILIINLTEMEDPSGEVMSSDDERRDVVNIETWLNKPDVRFAYPCQHVKETGYTYNRSEN